MICFLESNFHIAFHQPDSLHRSLSRRSSYIIDFISLPTSPADHRLRASSAGHTSKKSPIV